MQHKVKRSGKRKQPVQHKVKRSGERNRDKWPLPALASIVANPTKDPRTINSMLFLARGIEDDHYWVVQEIDGTLIEAPWRIEHEADGYRLSHADDSDQTELVHTLGAFPSAEAALVGLCDLI